VVYGGDTTFPPFEWLDASGHPRGFNVELIRALGREAGVEVEVRLGGWAETMGRLDRGEVDLMSLARSQERELAYDFFAQTWTLHQAVLFHPGRAAYPQRLDLLADEVVAIERRSLLHELIEDLPEIQRPVLIFARDQYESVRLMESGRVTAMAGNALSLRFSAAELGVHDLVTVPMKAMSYHLAARKGRRADLAWIDPAMERLRASGRFDRLVAQHLVRAPDRTWRDYALIFGGLLGAIVAVVVGAVVWNRSLRRQVHARTQELGAMTEALRNSEQAAVEASRLKSEFLANMSHEIRTPMNGVLGMTELLMASPLTDEQRESVDVIAGSGRALLEIINDILDLSRIEAGRLELEETVFDPRALARDVARALGRAAQAKGLALRLDVAEGAPGAVRGDAFRLRQALTNLLGNAVKFTERGRVDLRLTHAPAGEGRARLRFEVQDTGVGIPAAAQARLFEPFSQADSSTTRRYGGSGLGLAISRRLAELMQGGLGFASTEGAGSTFWLEVPLPVEAGEPAPAAPQEPAVLTAPRSGRVLVVEDNLVNQRVAQRLLESLGLEVDVADGGRQALALSAHASYDAIFMDAHMPDLDGLQTTALIRRAEAGGRRTPIIALTARAMEGDRDRCLAAGMDDYLSKPVTVDDLRRVVGRWLPAGHAASPPFALDPLRLEDLRSLGDDSFVRDLLRSWLDHTADDLDRLDAALRRGDAAALRTVAHRLKGGSGSVGAQAMAELCDRLEAVNGGTGPSEEATVAALRARYDETRRQLADWLREPAL
jgi:signal transduction histidine kinase/CheY-like chemotaxis protein/HPt (histidine-containing phosphotransfer) domain-containing protein